MWQLIFHAIIFIIPSKKADHFDNHIKPYINEKEKCMLCSASGMSDFDHCKVSIKYLQYTGRSIVLMLCG